MQEAKPTMLQALLAGVASIKAHQTRMTVIGDNLANVNTNSFKRSRVTFEDVLAQNIRGATRPTSTLGGTNPVQIGLGVLVAGTDLNMEQGSLNSTGRQTDLAVQGNGHLMIGNGTGVFYTRDGAIDMDANGDLVHRATGMRLLGWTASPTGVLNTSTPVTGASSLRIPIGQQSTAQVTGLVNFAGNLDANALATDEWRTTIRVYDQLGGAHDVEFRFFNRITGPASPPAPAGANSSWSWEATDVASTTIIGTSEGATPTGERLFFDGNGALMNTAAVNNVAVPAGNAPAFTFAAHFDKVGQLAMESQVQATSQDGFPPGTLSGFSIGSDGIISGIFTNGLALTLGQISLAIFPNPAGLLRIGENVWHYTDNSGLPVVGTPQSGGRGAVSSGFLEQSNVDIGTEFTELIVTQRGFQANTKVVTTVDEMLQDLLNMKR